MYFIYLKFNNFGALKLIDIIAWTLYFIFTVGIFAFLFFNHLPLARKSELVIIGKTFQIIQGDNFYLVNFSDIENIVEYSANRLPWGYIMKWKIKTNNTEILISSLTISQLNFERHFYTKIKHETKLLPTI